jgi:membrane protease subunit (stomatin/prohibitin family)
MGTDNVFFLEVIECFHEDERELVYRIPQRGSGEIKFGAQLIVRDSQAAVLFYKGKSYEAYGPGRHTLTTANIPVLTKVLSLPWGMTSPLRAEVYFVNMRIFPNLKWGTRDPVAFKDSELGLVRLRAHGVFNIRVMQPVLFINTLVGTMGKYSSTEIEDYLKEVIVSRFNDYLGAHLDSLLNLPGRYDEISKGLQDRVREDLQHFGLGLESLWINAVTPPADVQKAIDDRSRLGAIPDLDKLVKLKAAMAMEKAAEATGEAGSGMGLGLGLMMPAMFADMFKPPQSAAAAEPPGKLHCPDCRHEIFKEAKFCPHCGHQQLVFDQCAGCGKNLPPNARFCPRCGAPADMKLENKVCPHCRSENLPTSVFCNQCGERLG